MEFAWLDRKSLSAGVADLEMWLQGEENASLYFWFKILKMGTEFHLKGR